MRAGRHTVTTSDDDRPPLDQSHLLTYLLTWHCASCGKKWGLATNAKRCHITGLPTDRAKGWAAATALGC